MKVGIIGLGNLGMGLARVLKRLGHQVCGVDTAPERLVIARSESIPASGNLAMVQNTGLIFILVPTTFADRYRYHVLTGVLEQLRSAGWASLPPLVISSTCPPEFFEEPAYTAMAGNILYNPFFVRQGQIEHDIKYPDIVLIGTAHRDDAQTTRLLRLYGTFADDTRIHLLSIKEAAIAKLALNTFLTMKIAYANLVGDLCVRAGADPAAVLNAVGADRRINPHYLRYGDGFGGPCLPIDLTAMADTMECYALTDSLDGPLLPADIIDLNIQHLRFQLDRFCDQHFDEDPVTVDGVAFKPGTTIITASQRLAFAVNLARRGYAVTIRDTEAVITQVQALHGDMFRYEVRAN